MNTRLLIGVAAAVGLMASAQAAHAEGASFDVQPNIASGASGTYHVTINRASVANPFQVVVTGNNDGRHVAGANPVMEPVKHSAGRVTVVFYNAAGNAIAPSPAGSFGASTTGGGKTAGPYTVALTPNPGDGIRYNAQSNSNDVAAFGGNQFAGNAALGSAEQVAYFKVSLQNSGQQWTAIVPASNVVPEPASLALVLPGLGPLGMVLLRRRARRG